MNRMAKFQFKRLLQMIATHCTRPGDSDRRCEICERLQVVIEECAGCEDPVGMANTLRELARLVK